MKRDRQSSRYIVAFAGIFLAIAAAASCQASPLAGIVKEAEVLDCLKKSKLADLIGGAQVTFAANEVRVAIYQDPRCTVNDLKINSALLAKELRSRFKSRFSTYAFVYFPLKSQNVYNEVVVTANLIDDFDSGVLSKEALLARITVEPFVANAAGRLALRYRELSYQQILAGGLMAASGEFKERELRKDKLDRILSLKASGYDVRNAERQFLLMEDFIRNKDYVGYEAASHAVEICLEDCRYQKSSKIKLASDERALWQR
jgi:hypothetical protein